VRRSGLPQPVRKGFAFPAVLEPNSAEAQPRRGTGLDLSHGEAKPHRHVLRPSRDWNDDLEHRSRPL